MGFFSTLIKALTPPGGSARVDKLQTRLTSPDARDRQSAVEQLGDIATAQTVRLLADVIRHDEEYTIRRKAISAFEKVGHKGARSDHELVEALTAAVHDTDPQVRSCAAAALESISRRIPE